MSAYLVAIVTTHTMDWLSEHWANVPAIVRRHGGRYLGVPKAIPNAVEIVEGTASAPGGIVLFSFPSMDAIKNFWTRLPRATSLHSKTMMAPKFVGQ